MPPPTAGLDAYGAWPPLTVTLWFIVMPASETMLSSTPPTPSQLVSVILNPPKEAPSEVGTGTAGVREGVGRAGEGLRMRGSEGVEDEESGPVWPGGAAEAEEEGRPRFLPLLFLAIETECGGALLWMTKITPSSKTIFQFAIRFALTFP